MRKLFFALCTMLFMAGLVVATEGTMTKVDLDKKEVTVKVDDNYLRESILNPAAKVVAGYQPVMPTYKGQISEEQLLQLLNYIKTMAPQQAALGGTEAR